MARRDWATAAPLLRAAIRQNPSSVGLHYGLGVSASHLDDLDAATREFQWVLEHAPAGSQEATAAGSWLAGAGLSGGNAPATTVGEASPDDPKAGSGALRGMVTWAEPGGAAEPRKRQMVILVGLKGTPTFGLRHTIRSDENGRYEFSHVAAGPYKLTDAIAGQPTWRLKITLHPGEPTVMDLNAGNSVKVRDDFPESSG